MLGARGLRPLVLGLAGFALAGLVAGCKGGDEAGGGRPFLYVAGEQNITVYAFNGEDGELTRKDRLEFPETLAFLATSLDGKFMHVLHRTNPPDEGAILMAKTPLMGEVVTYSINQTSGKLKEVSRVSSGGGRPTYITLDKTGKYVFVANNLGHVPGQGNSIAVFKVKSDGKLAEAHQTLMAGFSDPPAGATEPAPYIRSHQIRIHPSNKYVYVPNIDSDNVSQFLFDEKSGELTPNDPPAAVLTGGEDNAPFGAPAGIFFGPRHLDFHPNGKWVYLSNEYSAQVVAFSVESDGTLEQIGDPVRGVPDDFDGGKWQSEIRVHPSGKFVYVGERDKPTNPPDPKHKRQDSMAVFAVNQKTGELTLKGNVPTDKTPRNFILHPSGDWLVVGNQDAHSLMSFRIQEDGMLEMVASMDDQHAPYVHLFVNLP